MKFILNEDAIRFSASLKKRLNNVCKKYNGWHLPEELVSLWDTLYDEFGIEILIQGYPNSVAEDGAKCWVVDFDYYGEPVSNCKFVYSVYEGNGDSLKNDYLIYFS